MKVVSKSHSGSTSEDEEDDDMSSLGDASPMNEAQTLQRRRQLQCRQCRIRTGSLSFVGIYILVYLSLSSNPRMITISTAHYKATNQTSYSIENKTLLAQMRQAHLRKVAATIARVYPPVSPSAWCIDGRLKQEQSKRRPMGLCYLKIPRAASTTLSAINQRIAFNFAKRQNLKTCIRHDGRAPGLYYSKRDQLSFLWTLVRNPADRALSRVAASLAKQRRNVDSTTIGNYSSFVLRTLKTADDMQFGIISQGRGGFQLQYSMLTLVEEDSAWNKSDPIQIVNPRHVKQNVRQVIHGYDFVGVVERFDESLVVLQLLMGLETSDILYFATRTHAQYERRPARPKANTFICQRGVDPQLLITSPVRNHLDSTQWFAQNYGDYLLLQAANQALDLTIWRLGLDVFSEALKQFRNALRKSHETCRPVFPCSTNGTDQHKEPQQNCYFGDVGCGFSCPNNTMLGLAGI